MLKTVKITKISEKPPNIEKGRLIYFIFLENFSDNFTEVVGIDGVGWKPDCSSHMLTYGFRWALTKLMSFSDVNLGIIFEISIPSISDQNI